MFPGKKSSTIDKYKCGDAAAKNGYIHIIKNVSHLKYTNEAMDNAATVEIVKYLHGFRYEGYTSQIFINSVKNDNVEVFEWAAHNLKRCNLDNMLQIAAVHGSVRVIKWIHEKHFNVRTNETIKKAFENPSLSVLKFLCDNDTNINKYAIYHFYLATTDLMKWLLDRGYRFKIEHYLAIIYRGNNDILEWFHTNINIKVDKTDIKRVLYAIPSYQIFTNVVKYNEFSMGLIRRNFKPSTPERHIWIYKLQGMFSPEISAVLETDNWYCKLHIIEKIAKTDADKTLLEYMENCNKYTKFMINYVCETENITGLPDKYRQDVVAHALKLGKFDFVNKFHHSTDTDYLLTYAIMHDNIEILKKVNLEDNCDTNTLKDIFKYGAVKCLIYMKEELDISLDFSELESDVEIACEAGYTDLIKYCYSNRYIDGCLLNEMVTAALSNYHIELAMWLVNY